MRPRRFAAALVLAIAMAGGAGAKPAATKPAEMTSSQQSLQNQMAEAQKWLGEQVWHIKEEVDALPGIIAEAKEGHTATQEEVGKLRDEVKGLYVELSSVKQQIEGLKGDIGSVDTNVYRFRAYSGFFLALMLLMVFVILVMTVRR
ncbi:MAG TPA: hypothetical protein VMS22_02855 [Candidatus Eisenbacteria bacterium]|nr:hypothetical protein [Candidatus Eisenbacteria bacterium]